MLMDENLYHPLHLRRDMTHTYHTESRGFLHSLPSKVLDTIHDFLSIESLAALSLTCSRFRQIYGSITTQIIREYGEKRLDMLYLLEVERTAKAYYCQGCRASHAAENFPVDELPKRPSERYCLRTKPCFRAGDVYLSVAEVIETLEKARNQEDRDSLENYKSYTSIVFNEFNPRRRNYVETVHAIYRSTEKRVAGKTRRDLFIARCTQADMMLCPHLKLSNPKLRKTFYFCLWGAADFFETYHTPSPLKCRKCKACATLRARRSKSGYHVELVVRQPLGKLISPLEPEWLAACARKPLPPTGHCPRVDKCLFDDLADIYHHNMDLDDLQQAIPETLPYTPLALPGTTAFQIARVKCWTSRVRQFWRIRASAKPGQPHTHTLGKRMWIVTKPILELGLGDYRAKLRHVIIERWP